MTFGMKYTDSLIRYLKRIRHLCFRSYSIQISEIK